MTPRTISGGFESPLLQVIPQESTSKSGKESGALYGKLVGILHTILEELLASPNLAAVMHLSTLAKKRAMDSSVAYTLRFWDRLQRCTIAFTAPKMNRTTAF